MHFFWFHIKKIILSRDAETNPGPQSKRCQEFSICHWNLKSIAIHSFITVSFLKVHITIHNYNIICLSENNILVQVFFVMIATWRFQITT